MRSLRSRHDGIERISWLHSSPVRSAASSAAGPRLTAPFTAATRTPSPRPRSARTRRPSARRGRGCTGTGRSWPKGFPVSEISDHLTDERATIWLDLRDPDPGDLAVLGDEFGLHPVAVEDALHDWERPKIDRYRTHLFLTAYGARLDGDTGELATSELSAFVLRQALITVRKDDGIDIGKVVDRWDASPDLAGRGVGVPAARAARLHRGRPLRGGPVAGRRGRGTRGRPVRRHPAGEAGAAAQFRAAQVAGPAAPGRAPDARGA